MALFICQLRNRSHPRLPAHFNSKLSHLVYQRRNNAWNFGLDPIKFRLVISFALHECSRSTISINQLALASSFLPRDPLPEVWIAIRQPNASRLALSEKSHAILTGQSQLLEVKNDLAIFPFSGDERFQFGNVLFVNPAA
jgi:hypothetical protein